VQRAANTQSERGNDNTDERDMKSPTGAFWTLSLESGFLHSMLKHVEIGAQERYRVSGASILWPKRVRVKVS